MDNKATLIMLLFVFFLGFLLRFYKLDQVPYGFYQDESAIGYNAYSILNTGKDEYGKFMPVYFKSFGDYKLPAYIYLTVFSIKIFGLNEFAVRFPSALFGSLTVILLYFLVKELSQNRKIAYASSLLLAINPWNLQFSRAAFEVNVALFFSLFGAFMFIKSMKGNCKMSYLLLSVFGFAMSLYSYNVTRLLSPLILIMLIFLYRKHIRKLSPVKIVSAGSLLIILLIPFIFTFFLASGVASARGALITSADIQAKTIEFRSYLTGLPNIFTSIFFNKWIMLAKQYVENIIHVFSTDFYFISGSNHGNQGIGNVGTFYIFQFPLVILGIILMFKDKMQEFSLFTLWVVISILVLSLSKEVPHATRGYFLIIPLQVFSSIGLVYLFYLFKKLTDKKIKFICLFILFSFIFYNVLFYLTSYYFRFPILYAKSWRSEDKTLSLYLRENEHKYGKIIFDSNAGFMYTSLLFYLPYSPSEFQRTVMREPDDSEGFSMVKSFGKYEFRQVIWPYDYQNNNNTLIITTAEKKPNDIPPFKTFYYPLRPIVFSLKEQVIEYPIEEISYVLVETK